MGNSLDRFMESQLGWAMLAQHARNASRPLPMFDEEAFETAVNVFHRAYSPAPYMDAEDRDRLLHEALEAFLAVYVEITR